MVGMDVAELLYYAGNIDKLSEFYRIDVVEKLVTGRNNWSVDSVTDAGKAWLVKATIHPREEVNSFIDHYIDVFSHTIEKNVGVFFANNMRVPFLASGA